MYKCQHFDIFELVHPFYFNNYNNNVLWRILDYRILITIDMLREKFGKIIINDYHWNGNYMFSGLRPFDTDVGAELSQHKYGRAFDLKFSNCTTDEVREDIIENPFDEHYKYITGIELEVPWLHIDCRNWNKENYGLFQFNP